MRDYDKITDWVIYKITSPSGRVYVGKTSNFKRRISQYRCLACVCQWVLLRSFKKYGFENHIIEVIEEFNSDIKYADGKEMMWIRSLMTNFSKWGKITNGLNLTDGGEGRVGAKASEETKQKLRDAHKRNPEKWDAFRLYKPTREVIEKIKRTRSFRNYPKRINKPITQETREKMSLAKKGKTAWNKGKIGAQTAWNKGKKMGVSPRKGVKFQGTSEERKRKFGSHNIGHTRNRGRKQSAEIIAAKVLQKIGKPLFKKWKKVSQFDINHTFIQTFPSIKEAADTLKLNSGKISAVVNGKRKTTGNYIFKFAA